MILKGVRSSARTGRPVGRQRALGSSFDCVARRSLKIFLPSALNGMVSPFLTACARSNTARDACQIPERSGLPSAVFGAGALRFGEPSGSRGIPGVLYPCHCANAEPVTRHTHKAPIAVHTLRTLGIPGTPGTYRLPTVQLGVPVPPGPDVPANTQRPSGSWNDSALTRFDPFLALEPRMRTLSPCFSDVGFHPSRYSTFGAPPSTAQCTTWPFSSTTST